MCMMVSFKTPEKGPKMLNPVAISPLAALAVLAALTLAALAYRLWLESLTWNPWTPPTARLVAPRGRHRLDSATEPYRPRGWATLAERATTRTAEQINADLAAALEDTHKRAEIAGSDMWPWSDGVTDELAVVG